MKKLFLNKVTLFTAIVCFGLVAVLVASFTLSNNWRGQIVRDVTLERERLNYQAVFDQYDNVVVNHNGSVSDFTGYQNINMSTLSGIDTISHEDAQAFEEAVVRHSISYDIDTNEVTVEATIIFPDGEVLFDKMVGSAFMNNGRVDAVMNIDGEGIFLSELSADSLIQDVFFRAIRAIATVVAVVAVVVVVVAVVVVAAPVLVPALAGAGAVAAGVSTAVAVGTTAAWIAAIATGVALTAALAEQTWPGIGARDTTLPNGTRVVTASWANERTRTAVRTMTEATERERPQDPRRFFRVKGYHSGLGPTNVVISESYTFQTMWTNMRHFSWSSLTIQRHNADAVIRQAFALRMDLRIVPEFHGWQHFHGVAPNGQHARGADGSAVVHSFWGLIREI